MTWKTISLEEAKAQAAHWDAMWEQRAYEESQTNEKG
jgi:hypothetical protein